MLDLKDRQILYQLDLDARQSFSQIAKRVRLSKETVQYRVKRLQEQGIIKSFITIIDSNRLGYMLFRSFVKCQNLSLEKEREIIKYLKPRVGWVVNVRGKWDFNIAIWCKDIHEFMAFWNAFYLRFSDVILDSTSNPIPRMWIYRRGWLLGVETDTSDADLWGGTAATVAVDELDKKILSLIVTHARRSSSEIARRTGVSEGSVRHRLKRLRQQKVILRHVVFLDTAKVGMQYIKLHFHVKNMTVERLREMREYARLQPNIIYGNEAIGGHFLEFDLNIRSSAELYSIIDGFRNRFCDSIRSYEFFEYTKEHKFEYLPG